MGNAASRLNTEELLHLALDASKKDQTESAIEYLKRAIELNPDDARIHYMLAAEHAQIGMYNEAAQEMERAVQLDPTLYTAHFQLGLLHLTCGRVEQAIAAWAPLDALSEDNFLFLFKSGLEHLARDEFGPCIDKLKRGIELNTLNQPLNNDMQRVITDIQDKVKDSPILPLNDDNQSPSSAGHAFISAYTNTESNPNAKN